VSVVVVVVEAAEGLVEQALDPTASVRHFAATSCAAMTV
jgi:hypothetical protein